MYKQSLSRGHRSKGIKGKHILQFCVLLVVSLWLIYQVKHSHDKSKEVKDGKILEEIKTNGEIQRLGRKDLPSVIATDVEHEEDNEPGEDKSKHLEDTPEREESNVSRVDGDSELNEKEAEPEEEQVNEVKEREDSEGGSEENHTKNDENEGASKENHNANEERKGESEENRAENEENEGDSEESTTENEEREAGSEENRAENEENEEESEESDTESEEQEGGSEENHPENEDDENAGKEDRTESEENEGDRKGGHKQSDTKSEDQDQDQDQDGGSTTTHEAQEELYKADDASSEVAHNVQTIIPGTDKVTTGHENGLLGNLDFGHANETITSDKDNAGEMPREYKVSDSGTLSTATVTEEKKYERHSATSESENSSLQNSTLPSLPKDQPENNSNLTTVDGGHRAALLSTETQIAASSNKTENVNGNNGETLSSSNTTSGSSHETNGADMSAGKDSSLDHRNKSENGGIAASDEITEYQSSDEDTGAHQHDPIDASDTELDTLPENRSEVQNTHDTEAE